MKIQLLFAAAAVLSLPALAQTNSQATVDVERVSPTPTFRVVVISRSVQAVNYEHRSGCLLYTSLPGRPTRARAR